MPGIRGTMHGLVVFGHLHIILNTGSVGKGSMCLESRNSLNIHLEVLRFSFSSSPLLE